MNPGAAADLFRLAREHMPPGLALAQKFAGQGALEQWAQGATVRLSDGREILDFGSYAVTLLGHRHPAVVQAISSQLLLAPTSTRALLNPLTATLAASLVGMLDPERLNRVWFGLNGSDTVELALKLSRLVTGKPRMLAVSRGFHGKTLGALGVTWSPRYRGETAGMLPVTHLDPDDPTAASRELDRGDVAGLIVEPIQGEGGIFPLSPVVLRQWAADVRASGGFVIADEIQCGLGRAGPISVALALDMKPDAILLVKALGGGIMPVSAVVASTALFQPLIDDPFLHTSTFSGHPLSCAAALASLDVLSSLRGRADELSNKLRLGLSALQSRYGHIIGDVRGQGLMWGVEIVSGAAGKVMLELSRLGLLCSPCLGRPEVIRLLPPMVTTDPQLEQALSILERSCRI